MVSTHVINMFLCTVFEAEYSGYDPIRDSYLFCGIQIGLALPQGKTQSRLAHVNECIERMRHFILYNH